MKVKQRNKKSVVVCYISGEICLSTLPNLEKIFKKLINDKPRKVLLNLKDVEYIDSSGFACLIRFLKDLKNIEGVMFLSDISPKIRSLFTITKLESIFKIYEAEEEALKDF